MIYTKCYRNVRDNRNVGWRIAEFRTLDRFRTPRTFNPTLTFPEACVAVAGALVRIFLGSILFAVCGAYIWNAWATIHNPVWRTIVVVLLSVAFVVSFGALMIGIQVAVSGLMRRVDPRVIRNAP